MKILRLMFFVLFLSGNAWAKLDFAVNVPVDIDAQNSVEAKDLAMIEAQR